jgi:hypothetical protein
VRKGMPVGEERSKLWLMGPAVSGPRHVLEVAARKDVIWDTWGKKEGSLYMMSLSVLMMLNGDLMRH